MITKKDCRTDLTFIILLIVVYSLTTNAKAEWISEDDYVVTVAPTPVKRGPKTFFTLVNGFNFRVNKVSGDYVHVAKKTKNGDFIRGWVRRIDVMKLTPDKTAILATRDHLANSQGHFLPIPKDSFFIEIYSDYTLDLFVVDKKNRDAYVSIVKNGLRGGMRALASKLNVKRGLLLFDPPDSKEYFLIIDNTAYPKGGTDSGMMNAYSLAFCIDDPRPARRQDDRGIIIGRATIDFDDYQGRNGREKKPFKVVLDVMDDTDALVKSIEASVDKDGYFFFENVAMGYKYQIKKLHARRFEISIPFTAEFGFGSLDKETKTMKKSVFIGGIAISPPCVEPSVVDLGHIAIEVTNKGGIQIRISASDVLVLNTDGKTTISLADDVPLDSHAWFLRKFSTHGWVKPITRDRDSIYKDREESRKKKGEKKKKQATQKDDETPPRAPVAREA